MIAPVLEREPLPDDCELVDGCLRRIGRDESFVSEVVHLDEPIIYEEGECRSIEFLFDDALADHAVNFIETYCRHSRGPYTGRLFILDQWERDVVRAAFGTLHPCGLRRYTTIFIFVARKNGKSTLAAAVALYLLIADGEYGAEVYGCASDKEQARVVFDEAKRMVQASPELQQLIVCYAKALSYQSQLGIYKVTSSDARRQHGRNPHGVVFDELHTQPNRDLWDAMDTAMGARAQPMMFVCTTAGFDLESICYEQYKRAKAIIAGDITDWTFLGVIFEAQPEDDWKDEQTWLKANPSLGGACTWAYMRQQCNKAINEPSFENTFKRLHLNLWTEQVSRWIPMAEWAHCCGCVGSSKLFKRRAWCGLDISSKTDLTAFVICVPFGSGKEIEYWLRGYYWLPGDNAEKLLRRDHAPYPKWISAGRLSGTAGSSIDYDAVRETILRSIEPFDLVEIAYDPYNAGSFVDGLDNKDGLPMIEHRQGLISMNDPAKEFERAVLAHTIRHDDDEVLSWAVSNLSVISDISGNIRPIKQKRVSRIDPAIAAIMAIGRANLGYEAQASVYSTRGVRVIG